MWKRRSFKEKKLIEHFYSDKDYRAQEDISVQMIDYYNPHDQERCDFWIYHLDIEKVYVIKTLYDNWYMMSYWESILRYDVILGQQLSL